MPRYMMTKEEHEHQESMGVLQRVLRAGLYREVSVEGTPADGGPKRTCVKGKMLSVNQSTVTIEPARSEQLLHAKTRLVVYLSDIKDVGVGWSSDEKDRMSTPVIIRLA